MKIFSFKRIAMVLAILWGMSLAVSAQDYSVPVKFQGQKPVITDFVSAILSGEELGEYFGHLSDQWQRRQKGQKTMGTWTVDAKNGFVRYEEVIKNADENSHNTCEFCYWNCVDNRHKLVATSARLFWDGRPVDTEHTGLQFYVYDTETRRMEAVPQGFFGMEIDVPGREVAHYNLPQVGKDITVTAFPSSQYQGKKEILIDCKWDGMHFHQQGRPGQKLSFEDGPIGPKETWEDYDVSLRIVDEQGAKPGYEAIVRDRDGKTLQVLEGRTEDRPMGMERFGNVIEKDINFDYIPDLLICLGGMKVTDQTFQYYDAWIAEDGPNGRTFTLYKPFRDISNAEIDPAYKRVLSHYMARDGSFTYLSKVWKNGILTEDGKSWNVPKKLEIE